MLVGRIEAKGVVVLKEIFDFFNLPILGCSIELGDEVVVKKASCSV